MSDNPFDGQEWNDYADRILEELVPMIKDSAITVSLVPSSRADVKFAVELGFCIMMDKPILAVIPPGTPIPAKIVAVADEIVEGGDLDDPGFSARIRAALGRMAEKEKRSRP